MKNRATSSKTGQDLLFIGYWSIEKAAKPLAKFITLRWKDTSYFCQIKELQALPLPKIDIFKLILVIPLELYSLKNKENNPKIALVRFE